MADQWNDTQPIYKQLRDRVARLILEGSFKEEEAIPSVRSVAAESSVNHLTVGKAYQALVDEGVLEMRRGLGMFVKKGARTTLLAEELAEFKDDELPRVVERAATLGLSAEELIALIKTLYPRTAS